MGGTKTRTPAGARRRGMTLTALRAPYGLPPRCQRHQTFKPTEDTFGSLPFLQNLTHTTRLKQMVWWELRVSVYHLRPWLFSAVFCHEQRAGWRPVWEVVVDQGRQADSPSESGRASGSHGAAGEELRAGLLSGAFDALPLGSERITGRRAKGSVKRPVEALTLPCREECRVSDPISVSLNLSRSRW